MPVRRIALVALLALLGVLAVACTGRDGRGAGGGSPCALETGSSGDVDGITERLRLPRAPVRAAWTVGTLGDARVRVPGPTDYRLSAVLTFAEEDRAAVAAALTAGAPEEGAEGSVALPGCLAGIPPEVSGRLHPAQDGDWRAVTGRLVSADGLGQGDYAAYRGSAVLLDGGRYVVVSLHTT